MLAGTANKDVLATERFLQGQNRIVSQAKESGENIPDKEEEHAAETMS